MVALQDWDDTYHQRSYNYQNQWSYWNPYYRDPIWYGYSYNPYIYQSPRVIIVQPETRTLAPGKRPSREGSEGRVSPYSNRGSRNRQ